MRFHRWLVCAAALGVCALPLAAQQSSPPTSGGLEVLQIRPNFYMIAGAGANIAVQLGDDGLVLIDTGTTASADQVLAEVRKLAKQQPIRYIINTNADPDH